MTDPKIVTVEDYAKRLFKDFNGNVVLGGSLGSGFPQLLANALFEYARSDQEAHLEIFSGLTLERPRGTGLEERLYQAIWKDVPPVAYFDYIRQHGNLPKGIDIVEFYFQSGMHTKDKVLQQMLVACHFSNVPKTIMEHGCNVLGVIAKILWASSPHVSGVDECPQCA